MKCLLPAVLWMVASTPLAADPARDALNNAVVRIAADGREGAGIIVGADDRAIFIVTAKHVVGEAVTASVQFNAARDRGYPATVYKISEKVDLAVVKVCLSEEGVVRASLKPLQYRADSAPLLTTVSNIAHSSDGWDPNFGINKLQNEELNTLSFSSGDVVRGASGGPLFDDGNRLIGMVTTIGGSKATAVTIRAILAELTSWRVQTNLLTTIVTGTVTIDCSAPRFTVCGIDLDLVLGGVKAHVTKQGAKITGVPLGTVSYEITGKMTCPSFPPVVNGSGDVTVQNGETLYLRAKGGRGVPWDSGLLTLSKTLAPEGRGK